MIVNAVVEKEMDPSMFVPYTPQTNGVPLESKLATYMVIICNLFEKTPNKDIVLCYIILLHTYIYTYIQDIH